MKNKKDNISNRRRMILLSTVGGLFGLSTPAAGDSELSTADDQSAEVIVGDSDMALNAIGDDTFIDEVTNVEFAGVGEQISVFNQEIQGFPHQGNRFTVLSSGRAEEAPGDPDTFASTDLSDSENFRFIPDYSPDDYDAYSVADLRIDFEIPPNAEGLAFDWQFATDESPDFLGSQFQDFFEVLLFLPGGSVRNIGTLPEGEPVTVDNADKYANTPGGSSQNPEPPLPEPADTVYNSITDLQTTKASIASYQGQTARLVIRVADASDEIFDSAVFVDNLRFVEDDDSSDGNYNIVEAALDEHRQTIVDVLEDLIRQDAKVEAEIYNEHGSEYAEPYLNYLGYRAGELDESAVDKEIRELLDETTDDIDPERISHAYHFYTELFDAVAHEDAGDREDIIYEYLMGNYNGQDVINEFEGQPLSDVVSDYETEVFEAYKKEFLDALDNGDYSSSDIADIASYIETQTAYVKQLRQKQEQSSKEVLDTLADKNEVTGSGFGVEIESTGNNNEATKDAGEPEAIVAAGVSLGLIALKSKGAFGFAAKGASSAYGSIKATGTGQTISSFVGGTPLAGAASGVLNSKPVSIAIQGAHHFFVPPTTAGLSTKASTIEYGKFVGEHIVVEEVAKTMISEGPNMIQKGLGKGLEAFSSDDEMSDIGIIENPDDILRMLNQDVVITDLEISNINLTDILDTSGFGNLPTNIHYVDGDFFGIETGSITIQNNGSETIVPMPNLVISAQNVPPTGHSFETGYPVVINDPLAELAPGETQSLEFEYAVPLSLSTSSFSLDATLERFDSQRSEEFDGGAGAFEIPSINILSDVIADGETIEDSHTPEKGTKTVTYDLEYEPSYDVDLHLYDDEGNHTGMDYVAGEIETEIPASTHSGDDNGDGGSEWVSVDDADSEEFTISVVAPDIGTIIQSNVAAQTADEKPDREEAASKSVSLEESDAMRVNKSSVTTPKISTSESSSNINSSFEVDSTEVADLDGTINISIDTPKTVEAGQPVSFDMSINEVSEQDPINDVSLDITEDLGSEDAPDAIPAENVEFTHSGFDVELGGSEQASIEVETSESITPGTYQGTILASANNGETSTKSSITVVVVPEPPSEPIADALSKPTDPNGDGLYEDISGNGELSIDDVTTLFENLDSETVQNNPKAFSFAGDLESGEVTLADVQALYLRLQGGEQ